MTARVRGRIRWRDGVHGDRQLLQEFICTPPVKPRMYGRAAPPRGLAWELDAQGGIRDLRPPAPQGHLILIGEDDEGIVAAAHAENDEGTERVFVSVMGIALRARGQRDPSVGDQLISALVDRLANVADAAGHEWLTVWGKLDPRNRGSARACERAGAIVQPDVDDLLHEWVLRVDFA